jgi:3-methyladenine DNA glycosylase AlkC
MEEWACDKDENIRRAASESLRGLARTEPAKILHVLQTLNDDESLYVRKSVASMLRNASNKHAEFVLEVARRWATRSAPRTNWIIKEGLKKLRTSHSDSVARLLASLQPEHSSGSS